MDVLSRFLPVYRTTFFVFSVAVYSVAMQYTAYLEVKPVHGLAEGFYREKAQIIH